MWTFIRPTLVAMPVWSFLGFLDLGFAHLWLRQYRVRCNITQTSTGLPVLVTSSRRSGTAAEVQTLQTLYGIIDRKNWSFEIAACTTAYISTYIRDERHDDRGGQAK